MTAAGELAWEYINPMTREGAVKVLGDRLPMTNSIFRALRYAADDPVFKGRDLTPRGTITELEAQGELKRPERRRPDGRPQGPDQGRGQRGGGKDRPRGPRDGGGQPAPQGSRP